MKKTRNYFSRINILYKSVIEREAFYKSFVYLSILLLSADTIYKVYYGITYQNRESCILYSALPNWGFLFYEYFIELLLVVVVGIFFASLLEKYFSRFGRFLPRNSISAFIYASLIPVCSCSVVPLIKAMEDKIPFRVVITFIVAAPLLNPYIIMLSVTVLGAEYALIRILCALVLAIFTGIMTELVYKKMKKSDIKITGNCMIGKGCPIQKGTTFESTFNVFKKIFPYIIVAGVLGVAVELLSPANFIERFDFNNNFVGTLLVIVVGVPVYFCNGADVLFLQPLIYYGSLPLSTAMAFSLTSTSVCVTSLLILIKYVGKKLTFVILLNVVLITILLSMAIQYLYL